MKPAIFCLWCLAVAVPALAGQDHDADALRKKVDACTANAPADYVACIRTAVREMDAPPSAKVVAAAAGGSGKTEPVSPGKSSGQGRCSDINGTGGEAGKEASPMENQFAAAWALNAEIAPPCLWGLCAYRPSYLAVRHSDAPNAWPYSPSPDHQLASPVSHLAEEAKFQISVKSLLGRFGDDNHWQVWAAYTQQSHWQVFDGSNSRPFRETDYEPEVYVNRVWDSCMPGYDKLGLRMLGMGLVHQSNGQSNPLSRSWNRVYVQGGFILHKDVTLLLKGWQRIGEATADDDNPRIENYIGRVEATLSWAPQEDPKKLLASLRLRHSLNPSAAHGSAQLEVSGPIREGGPLRWYLQAFRGYGESMLDYNHLQTTIGGGIAFLGWGW